MRTDVDVIVVGGRVAGAATAMLLARSGLRVAVLERGRYGADTLSTHALMRAGVLQLARWGLLPAVVAAGTPPVRSTTFHYERGETVHVSIRPSAGVPELYAPRRTLLDRLLLDAAVAAGAEVRHRCTVTGLLRDRNGRVQGVRTRMPDGTERRLTARIVVGADGLRSVVAREVAATPLWRGRYAGASLYRYVAGLPADGYQWAYGDRAGAGAIPTNDGLTCVFVGSTPRRLAALRRDGAETAFRSLLTAAAPALAEQLSGADEAGPLRGWRGVPGHLLPAGGPGWALVGDAGHFKDPITAHGITDALRDAELLSEAVVDHLAAGVPEREALECYQRTRDRLSRPLLAATERVAAYDWDDEAIRRALRSVSAAMSDEVEHLAALPANPVAGPAARLVRLTATG